MNAAFKLEWRELERVLPEVLGKSGSSGAGKAASA
jgi:hypothetical protein